MCFHGEFADVRYRSWWLNTSTQTVSNMNRDPEASELFRNRAVIVVSAQTGTS